VGIADEGDRFRPLERGALALGVERGFAPGVQRVEALLGFPGVAGVLGVHVDAVGAAVDLRGAGLHELEEPGLDRRGGFAREREHRLAEAGVQVFADVDSGAHVQSPLVRVHLIDVRQGWL